MACQHVSPSTSEDADGRPDDTSFVEWLSHVLSMSKSSGTESVDIIPSYSHRTAEVVRKIRWQVAFPSVASVGLSRL